VAIGRHGTLCCRWSRTASPTTAERKRGGVASFAFGSRQALALPVDVIGKASWPVI
jgi:hypothetical protein